MPKEENKAIYLLFDGDSVDGRGSPQYSGKTEDYSKAKAHYEKCGDNPYSTGKVMILTDHEFERLNQSNIEFHELGLKQKGLLN